MRNVLDAPADRPHAQNRGSKSARPGWRARAGVLAAATAMVSTIALIGAVPAMAAPAPIKLTSSSCPSVIQKGQVSGCVTELQNLLNAHGAGLTVDGEFGPATLYAVREYQAAPPNAGGRGVGPQTKSYLFAPRG
ncbi:peptidoglycan-binding protein [Streptomyces sp. NPDC059766]|uniref:peptidoglycan-binding domain-containing protein n=1 Tax=Streptomyces sp. NPDC059766 TaxID=3346940 RepID=UPI003652B4C1